MTLKNLKKKTLHHLPEIIGGTVAAAVVTAAVVVVAKTLKDASIATSIRDSIPSRESISGNIDPNFLHNMIGEAKEFGVTFISDKEAIIFLSK